MIRFCDSFGHYTTQAALYAKWSFGSGSQPQLTGGRDNGPCVNGFNSGYNQIGRLLNFNFSAGQTFWITGLAAQGASQTVLAGNVYGGAFTTSHFTDFLNGGTAEWGMSGYSLAITGAGGMTVTVNAFYQDGSGAWNDRTQFVSTAFQYQTAPLNPALWYYFEVKVFVDTSHGNQVSLEVRVNGTVVYALTAVAFSGFPGVWPALHTFAPVITGNYLSADFVCLDNTGAFNTSYLGDVRVVAQLPISDGHYQDWTPLTAGTHWSEVGAASPPGDAAYVSSSTPGNTDSYGFSTPPSTTQVFGVQVNLSARKSDAGGRAIEALARLSSIDALSSPQTLSTSYGDFMSVFETDPSGAAWTSASLALAEFGVKLSA